MRHPPKRQPRPEAFRDMRTEIERGRRTYTTHTLLVIGPTPADNERIALAIEKRARRASKRRSAQWHA